MKKKTTSKVGARLNRDILSVKNTETYMSKPKRNKKKKAEELFEENSETKFYEDFSEV